MDGLAQNTSFNKPQSPLFLIFPQIKPDFVWIFRGSSEIPDDESFYGKLLQKNYISKTTMELSGSFLQN